MRCNFVFDLVLSLSVVFRVSHIPEWVVPKEHLITFFMLQGVKHLVSSRVTNRLEAAEPMDLLFWATQTEM